MKTVSMKKFQIQQILTDNIDKHREEFLKSVKDYELAVQKYHEKLYDHYKNFSINSEVLRYDPPTRPVSYLDKLYEIKKMLSYDTRDVIELPYNDYDEIVNLNFAERQIFMGALMKNMTYL